ncbi:hypothetical protein DSM19430T_04290 [Desulfovibrio psychrotolerans]|uniref:Uncharacterized protein n=1 Tax=Desulfovibrio psychrotolerans TaxID=415242 RepID=A0A7J0BRH8_9BACT|nr:hypothetical protein DSM19430T_04290 [Desulfovibrio psychrotolerans]
MFFTQSPFRKGTNAARLSGQRGKGPAHMLFRRAGKAQQRHCAIIQPKYIPVRINDNKRSCSRQRAKRSVKERFGVLFFRPQRQDGTSGSARRAVSPQQGKVGSFAGCDAVQQHLWCIYHVMQA